MEPLQDFGVACSQPWGIITQRFVKGLPCSPCTFLLPLQGCCPKMYLRGS